MYYGFQYYTRIISTRNNKRVVRFARDVLIVYVLYFFFFIIIIIIFKTEKKNEEKLNRRFQPIRRVIPNECSSLYRQDNGRSSGSINLLLRL